jgi:lipopolysaccharide transport system ATP-binding protein
MSDTVIRVEGLGKRYRISTTQSHQTVRDAIAAAVKAPFRAKESANDAAFWALRDISMNVRRSEVVGVIGRNGAGKSTLLKILARITRPTEGWAEIKGRVASLLEVGTGFHGELNGRENIFLSGAVLGMKKAEILKKFDEIVAFSEVERFLDTPLKHYSSGMQMRLAFAVAAHLEPEILLMDEVLAVGDISFQRKCLGKMGEVAKQGRTILFISHQMVQIRRLCHRTFWLDGGTIRESGDTADVVGAYEAGSFKGEVTGTTKSDASGAQFLRWELVGTDAERATVLDWHGEVRVKFVVRVDKPLKNLHHGVNLYNQSHEIVWGSCVEDVCLSPGLHEIICEFPSLPLRPGAYTWRVSFYDREQLVDDWECVPPMLVSTQPLTHRLDKFAGVLNIPAKFTIRQETNGVHV